MRGNGEAALHVDAPSSGQDGWVTICHPPSGVIEPRLDLPDLE